MRMGLTEKGELYGITTMIHHTAEEWATHDEAIAKIEATIESANRAIEGHKHCMENIARNRDTLLEIIEVIDKFSEKPLESGSWALISSVSFEPFDAEACYRQISSSLPSLFHQWDKVEFFTEKEVAESLGNLRLLRESLSRLLSFSPDNLKYWSFVNESLNCTQYYAAEASKRVVEARKKFAETPPPSNE
jgi:hypothetical protein